MKEYYVSETLVTWFYHISNVFTCSEKIHSEIEKIRNRATAALQKVFAEVGKSLYGPSKK